MGHGVVLLVAGVFVTDPSLGYPPGAPAEHTTHGMIHGLAALSVYTLNALAAFATARHFFGAQRSRGWAIYGLLQRISIVVGWTWIAAFAFRLWRSSVTRP